MVKTKNNKLEKKVNSKRNLSEYWSFVKEYKLIVFGILFMVFITELSMIVPKFLFREIIDRGTEFVSGVIQMNVFVKILLIILVIYVITSLIELASIWLRTQFSMMLDSKIIQNIKLKYFNHIIDLDHEFHTNHKTGSLISRVSRGANASESMTDTVVFSFAPFIIQLIISGISIIYFSLIPALIVLGITITFIIYNFIMQRAQQELREDYNKQEDIEKGNLADFFTNISSIKYFGKEKLIKSKFEKLTENTKKKQLKFWGFYRWFDTGQIFIIILGTILVLYFPLLQFLNNQISLGTVSFIYTTYLSLIGSMWGFVHGMRNYSRAMADFEDLFNYKDFENKINENPNAKKAEIKNGEIQFRNVGFKYGKRTLFENFNLKIPNNKKVALVGHSGCGKTTLVKLLYRLYDVDDGEILIDNKNINQFKQESLRGEMSIVPQEAILFDDTIYNNIAFSNPNASREEVLTAIKFAQLDKIIKDFPKKENTIVGERGVKLSGGEKQRVSIARAILANKKILVLDEATSALDSKTESEIQKDLAKLMEGRTSIIIAHRLSTIMKADKIVVMKKGQIIQTGTHNQLIKQQGQYKRLWNLQKGGYIK